ncbi:hypothetical protein ACLB2K_011935 [Fragaria x ananassa]
MQSASTKWREFKSHLTSKYIIPYLDSLEKLKFPPNDYPFIPPDHWTIFVKSRTTPEFLIEELGEEGVGLVPGEEEIDRDITWVRGRIPKEGEIPDEETKKAVERVAEVRKEVDEGKRTAAGMNNILTQALETLEHSDRVRGVGGHITPHEYFGLPNLRKQSFEARMRKIVHEDSKKIIEEAKPVILKEAKEQLREEIEAEEAKRWEEKFEEFITNLLAGHFGAGIKHNTPLSGQGSSHTMEEGVSVPNLEAAQSRKKKKLESVDALEEKKDSEVGDPEIDCKLAVGSVDNIVAHATIMESDDDPKAVIHGRPSGDDNRRVSVYYAIDEKAKVPFPVEDEIVIVKHAIGSWVAWPKDLIILPNEKPGVDKVSKKKRKRSELAVQMEEADVTLAELAPNQSGPYEMLCTAFKDGRELSSNIEPEVFRYIYSSYITGKDVVVIATMKKVIGNLIASYQRYLYSKLEAYRMVDIVVFVHPNQIGAVGCGTGTQRTENIAKRLATAKLGQVFMLPYNSGDYWTLTVVDPDNDTVYFMDPVRRHIPCGDWAKIVKEVHGKQLFEYADSNPNFNGVFNSAMVSFTTLIMWRILDSYKGFEHLTQLVDVGGGLGVALSLITSRYPHIKGINYDLPHVIKQAPQYSGVEHVGGDMFSNIPNNGKVIVVEVLVLDEPISSPAEKIT